MTMRGRAAGRSIRPDLIISTDAKTLEEPAGVIFSLDHVPSDLSTLVQMEKESGHVVDWLRSDPLLQHVELTDVILLDRPIIEPGTDEASFEQLGYQTLVHGAVPNASGRTRVAQVRCHTMPLVTMHLGIVPLVTMPVVTMPVVTMRLVIAPLSAAPNASGRARMAQVWYCTCATIPAAYHPCFSSSNSTV